MALPNHQPNTENMDNPYCEDGPNYRDETTEMLHELMAVKAERDALKTERLEMMQQIEYLGHFIGRHGMTAAHIVSETASLIETLRKEKDWLIEKGERLVRWVESPRHTHEEVRDHNGRLKDTGTWCQFYVAVRGIQRKDSDVPISGHNAEVRHGAKDADHD